MKADHPPQTSEKNLELETPTVEQSKTPSGQAKLRVKLEHDLLVEFKRLERLANKGRLMDEMVGWFIDKALIEVNAAIEKLKSPVQKVGESPTLSV